ncbi:MAG: hypothetical protein AAF630_14000 [Cyanobacteria bacterium P01_C01_bin.38]
MKVVNSDGQGCPSHKIFITQTVMVGWVRRTTRFNNQPINVIAS